jgi:hypothetical protein
MLVILNFLKNVDFSFINYEYVDENKKKNRGYDLLINNQIYRK